jgi:hypothetical protein
MLQAAKAALEMGLHVFPLTPKQKAPPLTKHGFQDATADQEQIAAWWDATPEANIGIACGESSLQVLDFDHEEDIPEWVSAVQTFKVKTARGVHVYFWGARATAKMYSESGRHIGEIKSNGGYVLAAGSVHPSGAIYTIIDDAPIVWGPTDEIDKLLQSPAAKSAAVIGGARIPYGDHDTQLTRIAGALRHAGAEEGGIAVILTEVCEKRCEGYGADYREMCEKIARSICKKPIGKDETVLVGGKVAGSSMAPAIAPPQDVSSWRESFRSVGELEAGDVRMLISGFLPEGTTFIGALPGEGKTLLGLSITRALTTGKDFLGRPDFNVPEILPVLYMIPESSARAFRRRCEMFCIPSDRSRFVCRTISEGTTLRLDDPILLEAVRQMKPVVILDTVIRFSDSGDENAAMQNKQVADDIIKLRQAGAVAVIGIHHATKATRDKGMTLETILRGTGDLAACADAVYGMLRDATLYDHGRGPNEIEVECVKPRDFEPPLPFRIAATRKTNRTTIGQAPGIESVIDIYGDFLTVLGVAVEANRNADLVRLVQGDPAITLKEIEQVTKLTPWVIRKALRDMGWMKQKGGSHQWGKAEDEARTSVAAGSGGQVVRLDL